MLVVVASAIAVVVAAVVVVVFWAVAIFALLHSKLHLNA